jgi:Fucose permease
MLMNKIGRKNTVILSLIVTVVSLLLPVFGESYGLMLVSFSLLGIGNALMQTSLNPLITNIIKGDSLASTMTFGQFVKATCLLHGPLHCHVGRHGSHAVPGVSAGGCCSRCI